ncbi:MAG: glycosyltransferase family 4 protein [Candidatus Micrarchaeaceae archaeon]
MFENLQVDFLKLAFAYESAFPWFNGGIEKRRYNILKALAKNKSNELHMFTTYREGMPGRDFVYEGVHYHCIGKAVDIESMYANGDRRSISMSLKFAIGLFLNLLKYRFDAIDTDAFPFLHIPLVHLYSKLSRTKLIITWHEVWSKEFWSSYFPKGRVVGYFFEKWVSKLGDMCIANSETTKELLCSIFGVNAKKVKVLAAAIDRDEISSFVSSNAGGCAKQDKFIVVNRLVKYKRVDIAIKAVARTKLRLVVVGKGPELKRLKSIANRAGAGNRIEFKDELDTESLFMELCTSKGLLVPSRREGLSLVTVEALAIGVPVVIVESSMLPKELRSLCIIAKDGSFSQMLEEVAGNYSKYSEMYRKLIPRVIKRFSNEDAEKFYANALKA